MAKKKGCKKNCSKKKCGKDKTCTTTPPPKIKQSKTDYFYGLIKKAFGYD